MPFIGSVEGRFGYSGVPTQQSPQSGDPWAQINTIAIYLRNYMADFRNPSFYVYQLDGSGFFINDGGGDMYDNGNVTTPWLRSNTQYVSSAGYSSGAYPSAITYVTTTSTSMDTDFYYASLGYIQYVAPTQDSSRHPLTVIGSRSEVGQSVGWQVGGNSGADGGGTLASGILYTGTLINGFTVHAFYRETYNAGDPSHCNLFILLGHPNWGSVFGTINSYAAPVNLGSCGCFFYTSGVNVKNILAVQTLLSKNGGALVTAAECQTVVTNFTQRIKEALAF
jgi:hypothetical protein